MINRSWFPVALVMFSILGCQRALNESRIEPVPHFTMRSNLTGTIEQASDRREIGRRISFINLDTNQPKVLFDEGTSPVKKVFDTESTVTLVQVASETGSVDCFVIDKKTGKFARASAGSAFGVYASASLGVCK